jgi:hypothetical protein
MIKIGERNMSAVELITYIQTDALRNKNYQDIFKLAKDWCSTHWDTLNLSDKSERFLVEFVIRELMTEKIGAWSEEDSIFVINFVSRWVAHIFGIQDFVHIFVLGKEDYEKENDSDSFASCNSLEDGTFSIHFSPKLVNMLSSGKCNSLLFGLQTIGHEVTHAKVDLLLQRKNASKDGIPWTKEQYIIALEKLTRNVDSKFYLKNYDYLLGENYANRNGLLLAIEFIKKYNSHIMDFYNQEKIDSLLNQYNTNFYNNEMIVFGEKKENIKVMKLCSSVYLQDHIEVLEKYPIYHLGFDKEGKKKHILQLLEDRNQMLQEKVDIKVVDDLYKTIINGSMRENGNFSQTDESELRLLDFYVEETGTKEEFVYDLMRYRLKKNPNMSLEKIEKYIQSRLALATKICEERQILTSRNSKEM